MTRAAALLVLLIAPAARARDGVVFSPALLPLPAEIRKAPIGAWSEYLLESGNPAPGHLRVTLLARDQKTVTLEFHGELPGIRRPTPRTLTTQLRVPLDLRSRGGEAVVQIDDNPPMKAPPRDTAAGFTRPSPRKPVRKEIIEVAAGRFSAVRCPRRTPESVTVDQWLSDQVFPLGLVKLQWPPDLATIFGRDSELDTPPPVQITAWESADRWVLAAQGTGGTSVITRPPVPWSSPAVKKQLETAPVR
jgi:hypothetical protein